MNFKSHFRGVRIRDDEHLASISSEVARIKRDAIKPARRAVRLNTAVLTISTPLLGYNTYELITSGDGVVPHAIAVAAFAGLATFSAIFRKRAKVNLKALMRKNLFDPEMGSNAHMN